MSTPPIATPTVPPGGATVPIPPPPPATAPTGPGVQLPPVPPSSSTASGEGAPQESKDAKTPVEDGLLPNLGSKEPVDMLRSRPRNAHSPNEGANEAGSRPRNGGPGSTEEAKSRPRGGGTRTAHEKDPLDRFRQLISKVTHKKYTKKGQYFPFKYTDVMFTLKTVQKVFEGESPLIEMKVPVVIVGDVHGQFSDLVRIFDMFRTELVPGYLNTRYVFLGDYVDRGKQSLEIVLMLFMLKCCHPTQFALLRGNHECRAINKAYGFFAEIKERFMDPRRAMEIFETFNTVFSHLPIACVVADSILCMHGGISSKMKTRDDIRKVPKPLKDVATNQIATDLLWADPMIGLTGEIKNKVRGVSVYFGEETLDAFCKDLNLKMVIRGHQMMMNGFNFFHTKLITVFSAAAYYPDKPNRGAICCIDLAGRIGFKVIVPHPRDHPEATKKVFRGDHDVANDFDTGYVKVSPAMAAAAAAKAAAKQAYGPESSTDPAKSEEKSKPAA